MFSNPQYASQQTMYVQLPWNPESQESRTARLEKQRQSEARAEARKKSAADRLKQIHMKKKAVKLASQEVEVKRLSDVLAAVNQMSETEAMPIIVSEGFRSVEAFKIHVDGMEAQLRLDKGEEPLAGDEAAIDLMQKKAKEVFIDEELLARPNDELAPHELKEKKRMRLLKTQQEMRQKAAIEKEQAEAKRLTEEKQEEERRLADPDKYLQELQKDYEAAVAKGKDRRKRLREEKTMTVVGSNSRIGREARERMRLVAEAAFIAG